MYRSIIKRIPTVLHPQPNSLTYHASLAGVVGAGCTNNSQCVDISNTTCTESTCQCIPGYFADHGEVGCSKIQLGSTCKIGVHEFCSGAVEHSYCDSSSTSCRCQTGYFNASMDTCKKVTLGSPCSSNATCEDNVNNSTCLDDICVCLPGFYNKSEHECMKIGHGMPCSSEKFCNSSLPLSTCVQGRCVCQEEAFLNTSSHICEPRKRLHKTCSGNVPNECRTGNSTCSGGRCSCLPRFYPYQRNSSLSWKCLPKVNVNESCDESRAPDVCLDPQSTCLQGRCQCIWNFVQRGTVCVSKADIGENCNQTAECQDPDSVCRDSVCDCKNGTYVAILPTYRLCKTLESLGSRCLSNSSRVCKDLNAECQAGTCQCKKEYYQNISECEQKMPLNSPCQGPDHCATANSVCVRNVCKCDASYIEDHGFCCKIL
ncbi:cell death abnormality protein 1-like [Lingula anatina]|uniref:Cell death abnormality protein 1-like n=1 Tax=Lingula anatina TaxID=7574 RepID=A0A1S3JTW8_LINAN|nr:cell death abnormality protein 1-like [Lingula anatina]|eukprot:XP_013413514.1 cell death abnormality protein 1-like [Lingula anatina]